MRKLDVDVGATVSMTAPGGENEGSPSLAHGPAITARFGLAPCSHKHCVS